MTPPPPSRRGSLPPRPPSTAVEDRLAWAMDAIEELDRRQRDHEVADAEVHEQVAELAESLGREGNAAKGRAPTGLHLAVEQGFAALHGEIAALALQLGELATSLTADRTARMQAIRDEQVARDAVARVKEPVTSSLSEVRREVVRWLVLLVLSAIAAVIYRHVH